MADASLNGQKFRYVPLAEAGDSPGEATSPRAATSRRRRGRWIEGTDRLPWPGAEALGLAGAFALSLLRYAGKREYGDCRRTPQIRLSTSTRGLGRNHGATFRAAAAARRQVVAALTHWPRLSRRCRCAAGAEAAPGAIHASSGSAIAQCGMIAQTELGVRQAGMTADCDVAKREAEVPVAERVAAGGDLRGVGRRVDLDAA